jgi:hypothetical protein
MANATELDLIEAAIKRSWTRLKRAVNAIDKLERKKARIAKKPVKTTEKPVETPKAAKIPEKSTVGTEASVTPSQPAPDTKIPDFLRRGAEADKTAAAEITAEQAERKQAKARGRIAKLKADKAGERRKMPLSGKAALAAIWEDS